jgi:ABC-2 type transport system ATP-binding protein
MVHTPGGVDASNAGKCSTPAACGRAPQADEGTIVSQDELRNAPSSPPLAHAPPADPAPRARTAALVVEGLSKTYEDTQAVRDLSFSVYAGEILGLVGPNGAGKTTTLRSICGVLPLQHGGVSICGLSIARDEARAKSKLAWIPDDPEPFDSLTVHEHLRFTAALYGVADWEPRAEELLLRFELQEKRDALGGELSRGMRQKLALCCAWIHSPEVVLMDEPLSGLDPRGIRAAKAAIRDLAAQGAAVILSSHLLVLIEELAHRILIVDRGRKIFVGTMDEARATLSAPPGSSLEEIFMAATEGPRSKEGAPEPKPPGSPPRNGA